jgi:hypothetical protein
MLRAAMKVTEHGQRQHLSFLPQPMIGPPERIDITVAAAVGCRSDGEEQQSLEKCVAESMKEGGGKQQCSCLCLQPSMECQAPGR